MKDLYDKQEEARINKAIEEMKAEMGEGFSLQKLNLSELERRCGVSRARLRNGPAAVVFYSATGPL